MQQKYQRSGRRKRFSPDIGSRIILLTTVISFIIILIISLLIYYLESSSTKKNLLLERSNLCEEANSIAENACSYLRAAADFCNMNENIEYILRHQSRDPEASQMSKELFSVFHSNNYILSISLFNLQGVPVQYMSIDASHTPINQAQSEIFRDLVGEKKQYQWEYIPSRSDRLFEMDNSPKICLWRVIRGANNRSTFGVIAVTMDVRQLLAYETTYTSGYRRNYLIFDSSISSVIFNRTGQTVSDEVIEKLSEAVVAESNGYVHVSQTENDQAVFYRNIVDTGLYTVYLPNTLTPQNAPMYGLILCFVPLTFLLLMLPLFLYISRNLNRPLQRLRGKIRQFSKGDFTANIPDADTSNDSIGRLEQAFNQMVVENKRLIEQTYVSELRAKEAELSLLQSQINPHYLYNLINTIHWSAMCKGDQDIADMTYAMGQILRISLNRGKSVIPVYSECDLICYYLTLQKHRYGSKLDYSIDCSDEAREILIPKLIFQPLVENSLVHSAENMVEALHVDVRISVENDMLTFEIEDDGAGISPEILELLPDRYHSEGDSNNGFAIRNIYERLKLTYGKDNFSFEISSEQNCGTFVTIQLPTKFPAQEVN